MKKAFLFFVAIMTIVVFFSSCGYDLGPAPIMVPYEDTVYAFHPVPKLEDINLCSGGKSQYQKVVGWEMATDTMLNRGIVMITVDDDGNLVSSSSPGFTDGVAKTSPATIPPMPPTEGSDQKNHIWSYVWPILIGLILLAGLIGFIFWLVNYLRNQADQNRRTEELHQQQMRDREWQRMVQAMGMNRVNDGDFLNRMNVDGVRFSISNENPPAPPAGGGDSN